MTGTDSQMPCAQWSMRLQAGRFGAVGTPGTLAEDPGFRQMRPSAP